MKIKAASAQGASKQKKHLRTWAIALLAGAAAVIFAGAAGADPPSRVARMAYVSGSVSFSPAGEDIWVEARINRPLVSGDRLWVDAGGRAELQVGRAVFHMGGGTSVTLLNLDDRVAQLQVTQGTLNVQVQRLGPRDVVEVDTPNIAYSMRRPGGYRISVDPARNATTVVVRAGQAEVYGDGAAYVVNAGQSYRFFDTGLREYEYLAAARDDDFDIWSRDRDRRGSNSVSARYVSRDVIGYEDLDEYGSWRPAAGYGNVWVPNRVAAGWAPYRDGHWAWVDPWGWTWVDDAPWGFAVSHYGRWANISGTWGWVPGPVRAQPVYAPALVAFIGGSGFSLTISSGNAGNVGWFPLGPRDVYRPSYAVSRTYFNNVNTSNTTVNNTIITNVYNNTSVTNITYVNQRVPGAVVAVPAVAFVQSQPVAKAVVTVSKDVIAKAPVTAIAAVTPVQTSVHGAAPPGHKPPAEAQARPMVAKEPPPAAPIPFAAKQTALKANPGKPLDAAALAAVKPAVPAVAPAVKVATPAQASVAPPKQQVAAPEAKKGTPPDAKAEPQSPAMVKGPQAPDATKAPPPDAKKGMPATDAQKSSPPDAKKGMPAPDAQKSAPPPDVQKGRPPEAKTGAQPPDAQKAPVPAAKVPPAAIVPRAPDAPKGPPPEAGKGMQRPDAQKAQPVPDVQKAAPPPMSAPRPPEVQRPPEARKSAPPPMSAPKPPEPQRPPEAQKAAPPPMSAPKPPEVQRPPEAQKAAPPPMSAPKPPEVQRPPEAQKAAPPPMRPPEAQKASPKPEPAKSADKRGDRKGDEEKDSRKQ